MKKIIALSLAALTVLTCSIAAFASTGSTPKITGMAGPLSLGYSGSTDLGEFYPSDERVVTVDLLDTMFTWDNYTPNAATPTQLTAAQVRAARLDARAAGNTGKVVKDIVVNARSGRIELSFIDELVGFKEQDFTVELVMSIDGKRQSDHSITFTGTILNPVLEVYASETSVDISDGSVIEAMEFNSKIEVELGNGVSILTKLFKGKKYYGIAVIKEAGDTYAEDHKEISEVLRLKTSGFSNSDTVTLDGRYAGLYIYSDDLELLGKGACELPLRSIYYLSTRELDIDRDEPVNTGPSTPAEVIEPLPVDKTPSNVNDNPGTGR